MKAIQIMKVTLFVVMGMLLSINQGSAQRINGNGHVVKQERDIGTFHAISVSSAFEVFLTQGNTEELVIEADENLMDYIETKIVGGTLKIFTHGNIVKTTEMKVYLTFKDIGKIKISGAVDLEGQNAMRFNELEIDASGASEIDLKIEAKELYLDLSGASEIELHGKVERVKIDCSGASDLDAEGLEVDYLELDASGASKLIVFVTQKLVLDVSGASTIRYKGDPTIEVDSSGASTVRKI